MESQRDFDGDRSGFRAYHLIALMLSDELPESHLSYLINLDNNSCFTGFLRELHETWHKCTK